MTNLLNPFWITSICVALSSIQFSMLLSVKLSLDILVENNWFYLVLSNDIYSIYFCILINSISIFSNFCFYTFCYNRFSSNIYLSIFFSLSVFLLFLETCIRISGKFVWKNSEITSAKAICFFLRFSIVFYCEK